MEGQALSRRKLGPFSASFFAADERAAAFLPALYRDPAARIDRVRRAAKRAVAPALMEGLWEQDRGLPPSAARRGNLEALAAPGTTAVVTGQQVGLFLGPLYTFYKAATAVAVAQALERESGVRCVPVFWLQTEDHDFAEVNHCYVPVPGAEPLCLELEDAARGTPGERVSLSHRLLGEDVDGRLTALEQALEALPHAAELLALLRSHYRPGAGVAKAFAGAIATLFADNGLIVIDPRAAGVSALARSVYRASVVQAEAISTALMQRSRALVEAGFEVQVHPRPAASLAFFHQADATGPRYRLEWQGEAWSLAGTDQTATTEELLRVLEADPLRFSSSALLRPIVQDMLLPTAAYVGGPGEINYFAQLGPLYAVFGLEPPLVVPRARFRCIEPNTRALLSTLKLEPQDAERPLDELSVLAERAHGPRDPSAVPTASGLLGELNGRLDALEQAAPSVDPSLTKAVRRTRASVARAVDRFARRWERAYLEKDRVTAERVLRLHRALHPQGVPQERFYSLPYFASKYGMGGFKQRVFDALEPFNPAVRDLLL